jgi:chromosome segregation ATPase
MRHEFADERDEYQSQIEELQDRLAEMTEQRDSALATMVSLEDQVGATSAAKDSRHWEALSATLATLDMVTDAFDERRQGQKYIHKLLLHLVTIQKDDPKRLPLVAELVMGAVSTVAASER